MGRRWNEVGQALARALLEPVRLIDDAGRRSTATLFAACLLALIALFGAYDVHVALTRPGYQPPWPGYLLMLIAYALVRSGYFYPAVLLTLGMLPTVAFALVMTGHSPAPTLTLTLPVLGILLATLLVDAWTTAGLTVVSAALVASVALLPGPQRLPWVLVSGPLLVVLLGGAIGVLSIVHRTRLERERRRALESSAAELEQRVRARTAELAESIVELETFSYSVSHDLRGPLHAIEGFVTILVEDHGESLGPAGLETLEIIRQSGTRMATIIDSLLELANTSRAPLQRRVVDLVPLAREVARELRAAEPNRRVELELPAALPAHGDAALMRTILQNLLGNAWKFSGGTAEPRIVLGSEHKRDRNWFVVRDNGAGFDMAGVDHLFRPFERLHRTDEFPGTGIGLATVARAVHRHGGEVFAEGHPGAGASFFFHLGDE